ncbi:hypothetical protein B566_EDAN012314 [Ephemera danica]|nr:hypothetical protein B566_EDAN012314 [Ephemera danica]
MDGMGAWRLTALLLLLLGMATPQVGSMQDETTDLPDPRAPPVSPRERGESCEQARLKCAYRVGCGMALQNYLVGCSLVVEDNDRPAPDDPLAGRATARRCPEPCQHALIALTSTDEGKHLMNCRCTDEFCEQTKRRVEVCRPDVIQATRNETVVSCRVAQWICAADPLCSTALDYYHRFCRAMFHGKRCSHRCNNSLAILLRQEKAAKLASCRCDGREDYDCPRIRENMARLCLHRVPGGSKPVPPPNEETNEVEPRSAASTTSQAPLLGRALLVLAVQLMLRSLLAQDT